MVDCFNLPAGRPVPAECRPVRTPGRPWSGRQSPFVSIPPGWGSHWRGALREASERLVRVPVFGASLTFGIKALPSAWDYGYVGVMRRMLQQVHGDGGSGFMGVGFRQDVNNPGGPVTSTGSWTIATSGEGGILHPSLRPTAPGNGATLTFPVRGRYVKVFTRTDAAYGSLTWTIDGDAQAPIALNVAQSVLVTQVDTGDEGDHTVVLTASSGDARIAGVGGYNDTGVVVENMSMTGGTPVLMGTASAGVDNVDPAEDTFYGRALTALGPADLIVLALLPNMATVPDVTAEAIDAMRDGLDIIAARSLTAGPTAADPPDLVWITEHIGSGDVIPGFAFYDRGYAQVAAIGESWARAVGAAHFDMWGMGRRSRAYWAALGYFDGTDNDPVHFNEDGHEAVADPLLNLIGG